MTVSLITRQLNVRCRKKYIKKYIKSHTVKKRWTQPPLIICIQIGYSVRKDSSIWVIQLYLLVDFCLLRSRSFVEFLMYLALTQVFDDFLFEVIFHVDISITNQLVSF